MSRKQKETALEERKIIIKLISEGKTYRKVGKILGRSHSSTQSIIKKYRHEGILTNEAGRGRKRLFTQATDNFIISKVKANPKIHIPEPTNQKPEIIEKPVSSETVRNVLRRADFHARAPRRKPFISEKTGS
ncbi:uncharacterized protein LOC129612757 [Condylostylus longicornis]|uniref:uncharacterized protein LOC129612757 n=1 Tax=Condylostylus longicornis TaxID=2530218 RepID=UPI00244DF1FE|nr:uncharacterized protein LOC129612757 [Condylostylus longicornis]